MIANWIHIVIVHLAVIGTPWMAYRVLIHRKAPLDSKKWKENFSGLIILGIISTVAYITGPETADWTKVVMEDYPQFQVEDHALWGRVSFIILVVTALIAIMGWASIIQKEKPDRKIPILLAILLIINTFVILYTAHLGGLIRRMDLWF